MASQTMTEATTAPEAGGTLVFLPVEEVERRVGLSRRTIYRMVAEKTFPSQINISERRIAWIESEVVQWQQDRLKAAGRA